MRFSVYPCLDGDASRISRAGAATLPCQEWGSGARLAARLGTTHHARVGEMKLDPATFANSSTLSVHASVRLPTDLCLERASADTSGSPRRRASVRWGQAARES